MLSPAVLTLRLCLTAMHSIVVYISLDIIQIYVKGSQKS